MLMFFFQVADSKIHSNNVFWNNLDSEISNSRCFIATLLMQCVNALGCPISKRVKFEKEKILLANNKKPRDIQEITQPQLLPQSKNNRKKIKIYRFFKLIDYL